MNIFKLMSQKTRFKLPFLTWGTRVGFFFFFRLNCVKKKKRRMHSMSKHFLVLHYVCSIIQSAGNEIQSKNHIFMCALISNSTSHKRTSIRTLGASLAASMFFQTPLALICTAKYKIDLDQSSFPSVCFS